MKPAELRNLIEDRLKEGKPFAVYRKPDSKAIVAWFCDSALEAKSSDLSEPGFVFAPFSSGKDSILFLSASSEVFKIPFEPLDWESSGSLSNQLNKDSLIDKSRHVNLVQKAVDAIVNGEAKKIVVSRREEVAEIPIDAYTVFMRLASLYPRAFSYIWYHPDSGLWTGATPETLVRAEDESFVTMSLAGTQRWVENQETRWGEKELEEQQMVTDLIREELGSMLERVEGPYTQRAGHLLHLRSDLHGSLGENETVSSLVKRLHPTAAVCGLPRNRALDFIELNEDYSRDFYTGYLGEMNFPDPGSAHLFVNLRCMQLLPAEKKAHIYVGGGITSSSAPEKEWEETRAKSETMKRVFS